MIKLTYACGLTVLFLTFSYNAHAVEDVEKYQFAEKGFSGRMNLSKFSSCELKDSIGCLSTKIFKITISTLNLSSGSDCSVTALENSSARILSDHGLSVQFLGENDNSGTLQPIAVDFGKKSAVVKPGDFSGYCGMGGRFYGKWLKISD